MLKALYNERSRLRQDCFDRKKLESLGWVRSPNCVPLLRHRYRPIDRKEMGCPVFFGHLMRALVFSAYELDNEVMTSISQSEFRNHQSDYIAAAQRSPVEITARGTNRRAVIVSPEFYDRAIEALENQIDIEGAKTARQEERISHDELMMELDR